MVDCGNPRCAQERRFFKKELLSWSKKVPLMIALEQIAASYSEKENYRQLSSPYKSLEVDEEKAGDWKADDCCFYCQGQLNNSLDHLEELLQDAKDGKLDAGSSYVRSLQDLLPFYIKHYTHGVGRELLAELGSKSSYNNSSSSSSVASTQVSTISITQNNTVDTEVIDFTGHPGHKSLVELKIPHIIQGHNRKGECQPGAGGKRGYTDEELEAAVADIQDGKLGTRRASSLYGIPRSTLRNKIYRSGSEMDKGPAFLDPEDSNSGDESVAAALTNSMNMAELVQAGMFPFLPPVPVPITNAVKKEPDCSRATVFDELSIKLEHIRRMHNLKGNRDNIKPAHINEPKLPLLTSLIRHLVEQRFQMELSGRAAQRPETYSKEEEAISSRASSPVMEERKSMAISVDTLPHFLPFLPSFSPSCLSLTVPSSFEDLRIPSYKPANVQPQQREMDAIDDESRPFGKVYETSRIGETLKDIIVKSISEKMKFHDVETHTPPMFPSSSDVFGQTFPLKDGFPLDLGKSAFHSCRSEISQATHPAKRIKRELCDDQGMQSGAVKNSSNSVKSKPSEYQGHNSKDGKSSSRQSLGSMSSKSGGDRSVKEKKTRPKRGQYRKYNSQLLIEAVRAVQRGEMSVHRAGSYFGVPHSTLEYKVKERHLLRQKKPREGSSSTTSSAATTAASTSHASVSTTTSTSTSSSTVSSTTQTSKSSLLTSTASCDSSASSPSSSSQTQLATSSSKADTSLPRSSSSPSSSLSALGFGLHKQTDTGGDLPWFQPYLMSGASPSVFDPALSLFPQGFALNTSASELLRKLQHKVQSKSSPSSPFSAESSFGFAHPNGSSSLRERFLLYN